MTTTAAGLGYDPDKFTRDAELSEDPPGYRPPMPAYLRDRIDAKLARETHRREAPAGCRCVDCIGLEGVKADFQARQDAERARRGEAPF